MKPRYYDLNSPPDWLPDQTVVSLLSAKAQGRAVVEPDQWLHTADLRRAIAQLDTSDFRLEPADPDILINILRQPKWELTLVGLVNYSGNTRQDVAFRVPSGYEGQHVGWISSDGGAGMLSVQDGLITVPELRYGCTVLLGNDQAVVGRWVKRNAQRFPRSPLPQDTEMVSARDYGDWYTHRVPEEQVPPDQTLCRHRAGAADRGGYLILDILAPKHIQQNATADITIRVLDVRYDYTEYWQLIFENVKTGERETVSIDLPADNPHGELSKLRNTSLTATWTPQQTGTYQAYLSYRVVRLYHDGEPFLEPEDVAAGYSGDTPANLFLKSRPLMKRPYEDRLRVLVIHVE
ncbi:hypothetical protein ACFL6S_31950 [Candidatus Poribacteria bacterium]